MVEYSSLSEAQATLDSIEADEDAENRFTWRFLKSFARLPGVVQEKVWIHL